jgi:uncharacterized membrane protein YhaH (DUF805 family)
MFENTGPRMSASDYWVSFMACWGVTFLGVIGLVIGTFAKSPFFTLVSVVGLLGSSVYIRIAQMQRCNDIGWPWQIPWVVLGLGLATSAVAQFSPLVALVMLPVMIIVGLCDFCFGIVVGFMPSKHINFDFDPEAYRQAYSDYGAPNVNAQLVAEAEARKQQAAARILAENPVISATGKRVASVTREEEPAAPPPRAMGFGRKGVVS